MCCFKVLVGLFSYCDGHCRSYERPMLSSKNMFNTLEREGNKKKAKKQRRARKSKVSEGQQRKDEMGEWREVVKVM